MLISPSPGVQLWLHKAPPKGIFQLLLWSFSECQQKSYSEKENKPGDCTAALGICRRKEQAPVLAFCCTPARLDNASFILKLSDKGIFHFPPQNTMEILIRKAPTQSIFSCHVQRKKKKQSGKNANVVCEAKVL